MNSQEVEFRSRVQNLEVEYEFEVDEVPGEPDAAFFDDGFVHVRRFGVHVSVDVGQEVSLYEQRQACRKVFRILLGQQEGEKCYEEVLRYM